MHTGFVIISVHPINIFLSFLYLLTLKNEDFDKENHDDAQCTELYTSWALRDTRKNIHKAWHEMERWTVLNSEETDDGEAQRLLAKQ